MLGPDLLLLGPPLSLANMSMRNDLQHLTVLGQEFAGTPALLPEGITELSGLRSLHLSQLRFGWFQNAIPEGLGGLAHLEGAPYPLMWPGNAALQHHSAATPSSARH